MIRQDSISLSFTIAAGMISIYLGTFEKSFISFFPALLLLLGVVFQKFANKHVAEDEEIDSGESQQFLLYSAMALFGLTLISLSVPLFQKSLSLNTVDQKLYGLLMAVSEEQFFRGFVLTFMWDRTGSSTVAVLTSATVFVTYHFAVLGVVIESLAYVFFAGLLLGWVAVRTRRLSPVILVHSINNFLAV